MRKILRVIYVVLMVLAVIVTILMINKSDNNYYNDETTETIKKFREFENHNELAYWVAIKNGDWSDLPLTDVFRKKYNEKDGIFGDMQFDKVEYRPYHNGKYPFEDFAYLVITQGKKKTAYTYSMDPDSGDGYNDIIIGSIYPLTDENGNELDFREGITKENFESQMYALAWGQEDEQLVGVTDAFHKKYPYFLDLFIHYSPAYNINFIEEKSSWEKKEAYFEVDGTYECIKRHYIVNFTIDSRGYLDDAKVKLVGEYPYAKTHLSHASLQLIYKNSNWEYLKLSDKFRDKYKNKICLFDDIDNINIDNIYYDFIDDDFDMIMRCEYLNKTIKWFYIDYTYINKDYLDDVEILPIDYDGEDAEEAKKAYIKQYEH